MGPLHAETKTTRVAGVQGRELEWTGVSINAESYLRHLGHNLDDGLIFLESGGVFYQPFKVNLDRLLASVDCMFVNGMFC